MFFAIGPLMLDKRIPMSGMPSFAVDDEWLRRALLADARAISRGDILVDQDDPGRSTIYPRYASRMKGAYLWDVGNARYVDYMLGYGPVILGHADDRVDDVAIGQIRSGNCLAPLWSPQQVVLTELLREILPGADSVYLLKTGSDANSAAVRLARIHTGRPMVVRWGYNGWHDWACSEPAGIPVQVGKLTIRMPHSDPDSLRQIFADHAGQIACVLTVPFGDEVTTAGHLNELRAITQENGALFILDEMRSGFRMAVGGAQEFFSVRADLCAYSKAMANGYPISAVAGRGDVMAGLSRTRISSTFFAGPVEMAAATATIAILRSTDALRRIWAAGAALQAGLTRIVAETGVHAQVTGYPPMPFLRFTDPDPAACARIRTRFHREAIRAGILLHPNHQWFVSAAHTDEDIARTIEALGRAMSRAVEA